MWILIISRFKELWQALVDRRESDDADTPVISKSLPIIKWTEAFADHLHHCIGVRMIPFAYVIKESEDIDPQCPPKRNHGVLEITLILTNKRDSLIKLM